MKHVFVHLVAVLVLTIFLTACGGGGGGGGGGGSGGVSDGGGIAYAGKTTQASLTAANANLYFSLMWNGSTSTEVISNSSGVAKAELSGNSKAIGMVPIAKRLAKKVVIKGVDLSVRSKVSNRAIPINDTSSGITSGTMTITGSLDDTTGTGIVTMSCVNFNDGDGYTYDGAATVHVNGYDMATGVITDATMNFAVWSVKSAGSDATLSGSIGMQASVQNKSEIMTINMDGRDNISKETFRFTNFVISDVYDSLWLPTSATETYSGRVYVEKDGYTEVSTVSPCIYSNPNSDPSSGGPIILAGAANSRASVTPLSTSYVKIEIDANGDAIFEGKYAYTWNALKGAPVTVPPLANAGQDQAVETGETVILNATSSTDLLGDPLSYIWTMTARPVGSKAVLSDSLSVMASFFVDLPGTYSVTLVVSNGTKSSIIDDVVITASGPANSGLFKSYVAYQVGSWPSAVSIGDVNGDGRNDAVLSTGFSNDPATKANDHHIFVFLQNAVGGFVQAVKYPAGNGKSVDIGDVNNDGRADVVVTVDNGIGVFYQNNSGGLSPMVTYASNHQSFSNSYKLKIGDLNHDGRLDVVSIDWGTQSQDVDVFYQIAGGTFGAPVTYTVNHEGGDDLDVADVNSDGLTDIIVMSGQGYINPNIGILIQKIDGTFNPAAYYAAGTNINTSSVAVGDVNGDSLQDVAVSYGANGGSIGVFRQNNAGTLDSMRGFPSYSSPGFVGVADVNSDGRKDIILAHGGWLKLGVYLQGTDGELLPEELYPAPYSTTDLAIGDLNGDGLKDVVLADRGEGLVVMYHK